MRSDEAMESGSEENSEGGNANSASRKPRDAFGHDRGQEESHSPRGGEGEEETGNGKTEEVLKDNLGQICTPSMHVRVVCFISINTL